MSHKSTVGRISMDFWTIRKQHKEQLSKALKGLDISEVSVDRIYAKRLKNIDIVKEFKL